jgi:hypothetical protein
MSSEEGDAGPPQQQRWCKIEWLMRSSSCMLPKQQQSWRPAGLEQQWHQLHEPGLHRPAAGAAAALMGWWYLKNAYLLPQTPAGSTTAVWLNSSWRLLTSCALFATGALSDSLII